MSRPAGPRARALTPRQARFVAEYLVDLNGTQAAIRAGYSTKGAEVTASKLLRIPKVADAVSSRQAARAARTGITQERVLEETALLSFSDLTHYTVTDKGDVEPTDDAPAGAMRALQSIKRRVTTTGSGKSRKVTREVEIKLWDKPGPLKLAGRHVGLFPDRVEVTGKNGRPIEVEQKVRLYIPDNGRNRA